MSQGQRIPDDDGIVDEIAIERRIKGELVTLRHAERREAVRILTAQGHGRGTIANRLHMSIATVRGYLDEIAGEQIGAA